MNATKRRAKELSKKANGIASRAQSRARKQHARERKATEQLVNGIVDGVAVAGAMFIGGAKFVADSVRETEKSRCRRIVAERLHRDPELVREILSEIDGKELDPGIEGDDPQEGVSPGYSVSRGERDVTR